MAVAKEASDILGAPAFGYDSLSNMFIHLDAAGGRPVHRQQRRHPLQLAEAREALQFFADGIDGGYFRIAGEDHYFSTPFNDQRVVMYIGSTAGASYLGSDAFTWNCAQVPFGKEKKGDPAGREHVHDPVDRGKSSLPRSFS
jgi:hypothetical protein